MNFLVIDFETMGVITHTCPVVNCSYVTVNTDRMLSENPYTFEEVIELTTKVKFNVKQQVKEYGYIAEDDTVDWWKNQPKEVRLQALPSDHDVDVREWVSEFANFVSQGPEIDFGFCRGLDFDPPILRRLCSHFGKEEIFDIENGVLPYWKWRDTRSFFDGFFLFEASNSFVPEDDEEEWNKKFIMHDSRHDVVAEVLRLQAVYRIRKDLL